MNLDLAGQS